MLREEEITVFRDVPGSPVVWTPHSHSRGSGFGPWWGTKIVYAGRCTSTFQTEKEKVEGREAWRAAVHGDSKSQAGLSGLTEKKPYVYCQLFLQQMWVCLGLAEN